MPPSFLTFRMPLMFTLKQLKISEICTLFQPIKLQIFCILTITQEKSTFNFENSGSVIYRFNFLYCGKKLIINTVINTVMLVDLGFQISAKRNKNLPIRAFPT